MRYVRAVAVAVAALGLCLVLAGCPDGGGDFNPAGPAQPPATPYHPGPTATPLLPVKCDLKCLERSMGPGHGLGTKPSP